MIFRHFGIEPTAQRFIMLKSRIHYRAGFKPIAAAIVECQGEGVTNADLSVYRYEKLKRPIYPAGRALASRAARGPRYTRVRHAQRPPTTC